MTRQGGRRVLWSVLALTILAVGPWALTAIAQVTEILPLPFVSQVYRKQCPDGKYYTKGWNNCGPASLAMVIEANGRLPGGLSDEGFVDLVREKAAGNAFSCDRVIQDYVTFQELDKAARYYGLCERGKAYSWSQIKAFNNICVPPIVIIKVTKEVESWLPHGTSLAGAKHFVVIVGYSGNDVWYKSPFLVTHTGTTSGLRRVSASKMVDAIKAATPKSWNTWAVGYGDPLLPRCDGVPNCNKSPGAPPVATPQVYDRVQVGMGSTCPKKKVQLYYVADGDNQFNEKRSTSRWLSGTSWQTIEFQLMGRKNYSGFLKELRVDPTYQHIGCFVGFSWIKVTNQNGDNGRFYDFYNHSNEPGRPLGELLGWEAKGLHDLGPRDSWQHHTTDSDPWIHHDSVGLNTGYWP